MRKLIEITFQSLNGVVDAPDIVQEAQPYFLSDPEHNQYARERLFAADALLLGHKTYEAFADSYPCNVRRFQNGTIILEYSRLK